MWRHDGVFIAHLGRQTPTNLIWKALIGTSEKKLYNKIPDKNESEEDKWKFATHFNCQTPTDIFHAGRMPVHSSAVHRKEYFLANVSGQVYSKKLATCAAPRDITLFTCAGRVITISLRYSVCGTVRPIMQCDDTLINVVNEENKGWIMQFIKLLDFFFQCYTVPLKSSTVPSARDQSGQI